MKFAHLTDIHLPIPGRPALGALMNKRALGYLSWARKRRHWHKEEVAAVLVEDIKRQGCDVALLSGDVVNIALPAEFDAAADWLQRAFEGLPLVLVPGNHDTYVALPWDRGLGRLSPFMTGARLSDLASRPPRGATDFPFVSDFGGLRVIAANSSPPTAPGFATGAMGAGQIERIEQELIEAGRQGRFRVLMTHHPVNDGVVSRRKAQGDRRLLRDALARAGVDLVLHGHAHVPHFEEVATPWGPAPVIGGGALSHPRGSGERQPGRYNLFSLERLEAGWRLFLEVRQIDPGGGAVASVERRVYERKAPVGARPAAFPARVP